MDLDVVEIFRILRKTRGVSQTEMAEIGGVSLATQQNYEAGRTKPTTDYLRKIAAAGFDVNFLLTGERDVRTLSPEDSLLLNIWHQASPTLRSAALRVLLPNGKDGMPSTVSHQTKIADIHGSVHTGSGDIHNHEEGNKTYCKDCNKILADIDEFRDYPICNPCIAERRGEIGSRYEQFFYNFSALIMVIISMILVIKALGDMEKAPVYLIFIIMMQPVIKQIKKTFVDPWILYKLNKYLPFHN